MSRSTQPLKEIHALFDEAVADYMLSQPILIGGHRRPLAETSFRDLTDWHRHQSLSAERSSQYELVQEHRERHATLYTNLVMIARHYYDEHQAKIDQVDCLTIMQWLGEKLKLYPDFTYGVIGHA